jgi:hypothetical protein
VAVGVVVSLFGCERLKEPTAEERLREAALAVQIESVKGCFDAYYNLAAYPSVTCPRSDQRLTFEKDSDGDAYGVCRCEPKEKP